MGRSSERRAGRERQGTARVIHGGWGGSEDEDLPLDASHGAQAGLAAAPDPSSRGSSGGDPSAGDPSAAVHAATDPSAPDPAAEAPEAGRTVRRRRRWLIGGVAALLALVLVLPQLLMGERRPEVEARSFLQAILDADTDTVREHMAPPADGALDVALTDQVMLASPERVDRFTIEATEIEGDSAEVTAMLRLGHRTNETVLHLTRHREGMLRRPVWELEPVVLPVLRLSVPVSADSIVINDVEVELPPSSLGDFPLGLTEVHLSALPGGYQLRAPEGGDAVTPVPARSTVPPVLGEWTASLIELDYEITVAGAGELRDYLIDEALAECAESTSPRPERCPFSAPEGVTGDGTWEILTPPQIHATSGTGGFVDAYGYDGIAEFTVTAADGTTTKHRVPIDGMAMGFMDREGQLVGSWMGDDGGIVF